MYNIPNGSVVKFTGDPAVYLVDGNTLRHFTSEVKTSSGQSIFNYMVELNPAYKQGFSTGSDISSNISFDPPAPTWKNSIATAPTSGSTTNTSTGSTTGTTGVTIPSTAVLLTPSQFTYLQERGLTENYLIRDGSKIYLNDTPS